MGCNQHVLMQQSWDGTWETFLQGFNPCKPQQHPQMHLKDGLPEAVHWGVFRWRRRRFILHCMRGNGKQRSHRTCCEKGSFPQIEALNSFCTRRQRLLMLRVGEGKLSAAQKAVPINAHKFGAGGSNRTCTSIKPPSCGMQNPCSST